MPKDFAVQGYKKEDSTNKTTILIVILTICIVLTFYLVKIKGNTKPSPAKAVTEVQITNNTQETEKRPRFEFYTMLPDNNGKNQQSGSSIKLGSYILQVAEFKYLAEAKKLSKKLAAKRYAATIKTVKINNKTIYQVELGPFKSNIDAENMQKKLSQDRYRTKLKELQE